MTTPGLVLVLLVLGTFAAGSARGAWRIPSGLVLVALSLAWLKVNSPMEGEVLVTVTLGHGFTEADVAGLVCLVLAAYRVLVPSFQWAWGQRTRSE